MKKMSVTQWKKFSTYIKHHYVHNSESCEISNYVFLDNIGSLMLWLLDENQVGIFLRYENRKLVQKEYQDYREEHNYRNITQYEYRKYLDEKRLKQEITTMINEGD